MKNQWLKYFILMTVIGAALLSCEGMAELFHGPKPPDIYTVTFYANGATGTPPEEQTVNSGTVINLPDKGGLSSAGNVFVGWSESSAGTGAIYSVGSAVTVTKDMIFYAQWMDGSTPQYTVTFNANGAASGAAPAPQTVYSGISITIPGQGTLAYSGKIFGGWNTQSNGGGTNYAAGAVYTVTGNVTLYAKWNSEIQYTLTYHANGASGSPPAAQTVDPGTEIAIQGEGSLTYSGRRFGGWNTQSNGTGTNYTAGEVYTVNGNVTLYAIWIEQYTVTFNANGASGAAPTAQTVDPGTEITLPGVESMTYAGRRFAGWNTNTSGTGTNYDEGASYTASGNVTLYAKWDILPTVTFNANGASGTPPQAQTVDPGTVISLPGVGNMTYTGRIFKGWNTQANGSGTGYLEGDTYTVNANVTLYAQWESVPITPPGSTLAEQLAYVRNHTGNGTVFDIEVDSNEFLSPTSITTMGLNITVNIRSANSSDVKTIQLEGQGHLFSIDTGVTVKLQDIVLRGHSTNNRALVAIGNGKLILNSNTRITGNINAGDRFGGGIYVNGGTLEIYDGAEIIENRINGGNYSNVAGGGINVGNNGNVIMRGGIISENIVHNPIGSNYVYGGGIYVSGNSTVTMSGGIISKNSSNGYYAYGGGVSVTSGSSFIKRAAPGNSTSGVIFGSSGTEANNAVNGGSAVYRGFGSPRNRNTTLGPGDEISTLSDVGWE